MSGGRGRRGTLLSGVAVLLLALTGRPAEGQQLSRVRAVLFYSPTCPHCHQVMSYDLPPLMREFGERLQIVAINTATPVGSRLYEETVRVLSIPEERLGVPTLVVGSTVLVGSGEIPAQLPGLVRQGLAGDGVDWPTVAAVRELLRSQGLLEVPAPPEAAPVPAQQPAAAAAVDSGARERAPEAAPTRPTVAQPQAEAPAAAQGEPVVVPPSVASAVDTTSAAAATGAAAAPAPAGSSPGPGLVDLTGSEEFGMLARFRTDPVGNTVAVAALFLMLLALGVVAAAVAGRLRWGTLPEWLTPVLGMIGLGVAIYLAFVEVTGTLAVCGPVGDCNTVNQSQYARLGGVIPVGLLGVLGYILLLGSWAVAVASPTGHGPFARVVFWGGALLGTLFSVYLTFLEPFVIGATCAWCVTSALVMTVLLLLSTPAALAVRDGRASPP